MKAFAKNTTRTLLLGAAVSLLAGAAKNVSAAVKLNGLFGNGAVLQQGVEVPVWGTANDGETVTVKFQKQTVSTTAKNGRWIVRLKKLQPGGPFEMKVTGENEITLSNVLVGEVWLASGQSNMAFALSRANNAQSAIASARDPQLHFFVVPRAAIDKPQTDVVGSWNESTPETAANFSAVAYFFGREIRKARHVPVGLIESSVGGTPAEAWTSRETLESNPELKAILSDYADAVKTFQAKPAPTPAKNKSAAAKKPATKTPPADPDPRRSAKRPCGLYNAMIAPLQPYAIAGVIWYQGEANSGRATEYQTLFPAMIKNWRTAWNKDFPFLFVQIAPEERMSPEIREAQFLTAQKVPRTAVAVITDIGEAKDIHPKQKEPVGQRLALAARAIAYGEKIEYSGPAYRSLKIKGDRAIVSFTHVSGGLTARGGELKGFQIAGDDGKFVDASATIEKDKVVVSNPSVSKPVEVRYGWANVPDVNLYNAEGLPASPFRTDLKSGKRK